jgi:hypothetical protein
MITVMALLDEDPLVIKIAAINNASVQHFYFICQSNHVVFDFEFRFWAPYMKLGLCRTKNIKELGNSIQIQIFNKLVVSSLFYSFWNFKSKTAFLIVIFLPLKIVVGFGVAFVALYNERGKNYGETNKKKPVDE